MPFAVSFMNGSKRVTGSKRPSCVLVILEFLQALMHIEASAAKIHVAFSPSGGATGLVVQIINSPLKQPDGGLYLHVEPIAQALVEARSRGVVVRRENYRGYSSCAVRCNSRNRSAGGRPLRHHARQVHRG